MQADFHTVAHRSPVGAVSNCTGKPRKSTFEIQTPRWMF